ncbi:MAG: PSD1 and planctomycete cytochrome C domain-containing protein [Planctomycetota bacterium]|nr:PSD1 and planctomycete cytochrome C domain-containing protein [Planctomycetota bacterium]
MSELFRFRWRLVLLTACAMGLVSTVRAAEEKPLTFEADIRPIFRSHCYDCHGSTKDKKGKLDLRLARLMLAGGETGPAIVAGAPSKSFLLQRLKDGSMPPGDVRVSAEEIDKISRWIAQGAKTARPEPKEIGDGLGITPEERSWWAFQPITRPELPISIGKERVRTAIDSFVLSRLKEKKLGFAADADRLTLVRRVYLDLLGLPPTFEQAQAFINDKRDDAYERLIDSCLESPHYGERWGRHWLDVAGYADSEGYTNDDRVRPYAYKYRDYVIKAFNADMPFDRFIQEQLAGDEMIVGPLKNLSPHQVEKLVATGFLRMAADGTDGGTPDAAVAKNQVVADTIKIVSSALLGLSVGCAQCHDHRYDPISQVDYYRIRAVFEPGLDWKAWKNPTQRRVSLYTDAQRARRAEVQKEVDVVNKEKNAKQQKYIQEALDKEYARYDEPLKSELRAAKTTAGAKLTDKQKALLKKYPNLNVNGGNLYQYNSKRADEIKAYAPRIAKIRQKIPTEDFVRALTDGRGKGGELVKTFLFHRGDHRQVKDEVAPGGLTVTAPDGARFAIDNDDPQVPTSGRRLAFARWLTNGRHPLVARVLVNRAWLHHFGRGIVTTPDEFGKLGTKPTHPKLLDWMASHFVESGWSMKDLHRVMMTSTAYRQSSLRHTVGDRQDGANSLYWHKTVQRLDAEILRDRILAVSGTLDAKMFGSPVGVKADDAGQISVGGPDRRSVYVQNRRTQPVALLQVFDQPVMTVNCSKREKSTVALQSLLMMNSEAVLKYARAMAARVNKQAKAGTDAELVKGLEIPFDPKTYAENLGVWRVGFGHIDTAAADKNAPVAPVKFTRFTVFEKGRWQSGKGQGKGPAGLSFLTKAGGHPQNKTTRPIRRWIAPADGHLLVKGSLGCPSKNGDGVGVTVYSSRLGSQGSWKVHAGGVEYMVDFDVKKGDIVDTIVDEQSANTSDSFSNEFTLSLADSTQGTTVAYKSQDAVKEPPKPSSFKLGAPLADQLVHAWRLAYVRQPSREETELAAAYLKGQLTLLAVQGNSNPVQQAMTNFCQALISSNEFLYSD